MSSDLDQAFEAIGREVVRQTTTSMDEHVESAKAKLDDENLTAFALVAIRKEDGSAQSATQRAVDPEVVAEAVSEHDRDAEAVIDAHHEAICRVFDEEVADR